MQNDSEHKKSTAQDEIPLLEDIVIPYADLPYVDLDEDEVEHLTATVDSEMAGIEEDVDDLALINLANDDQVLAELIGNDSYDYDDMEESDAVSSGFALPQHDVVIAAIRATLQQQLAKEMSELIAPVLEQTIQQFSQQIRHEISDSMEGRIAELIQQELDKQFRRGRAPSNQA